jgi:two-component system, NarL family, response regulator YdfI
MATEAKRPTVIVADDIAAVHPLISRILHPELEIIEDVFDGQALLEAVNRLCPDLVVVDIYMPVLDGIEAVKRIHARFPKVAAVLISTDVGEENRQRARESGARAFIHKASAAEELLPAARAALRGEQLLR